MFQLTQDRICGTGNFTRGINIFNAYSPDSAPGTSLQVTAEGGNQ